MGVFFISEPCSGLLRYVDEILLKMMREDEKEKALTFRYCSQVVNNKTQSVTSVEIPLGVPNL